MGFWCVRGFTGSKVYGFITASCGRIRTGISMYQTVSMKGMEAFHCAEGSRNTVSWIIPSQEPPQRLFESFRNTG